MNPTHQGKDQNWQNEGKTVEEIKEEIRDLIDRCAKQGVLIESITPEFVGTFDGQAIVTFINIVERRLI